MIIETNKLRKKLKAREKTLQKKIDKMWGKGELADAEDAELEEVCDAQFYLSQVVVYSRRYG